MNKQPTKKQSELLLLLYKFRFVTVELAAAVLGAKSENSLRDRLGKLVEQEYIGRRHGANYRIDRRPAEYFLLPKGIQALKQRPNCNAAVLHNIYRDKTATDTFVQQKLAILQVYCQLQGLSLKFLTQSQLADFKGFPKPLPDGFISLKTSSGNKYFFLEVLREADPFFVTLHRRGKRYIAYAESGDWQIAQRNTPLPATLIVCDTPALQKRVGKRIAKLIEASWSSELAFYSATLRALSGGADGRVWFAIDSSAEQVSPKSLVRL